MCEMAHSPIHASVIDWVTFYCTGDLEKRRIIRENELMRQHEGKVSSSVFGVNYWTRWKKLSVIISDTKRLKLINIAVANQLIDISLLNKNRLRFWIRQKEIISISILIISNYLQKRNICRIFLNTFPNVL